MSVGWMQQILLALRQPEISAEFRPLIGDHLDRMEEERRYGFGRYGIRRA
ncbi:MAG TPA: hypothetical protein VND94_01960 [Terriglobia bacterium]|nr:hypothetical protein [Terriglobia bacterium]